MAGANALAYYYRSIIIAIKSFKVKASEVNIIELFTVVIEQHLLDTNGGKQLS